MTGFSTTDFKVSTADGRNFVLLEPVTYTTRAGEVITVPAGAKSDGASTPRVLWREIPPFGPYWPAAFLHDHLYRDTTYPKDFCDGVLLEAMESLGVNGTLARVIYQGVVIGGEISFATDRAAPK